MRWIWGGGSIARRGARGARLAGAPTEEIAPNGRIRGVFAKRTGAPRMRIGLSVGVMALAARVLMLGALGAITITLALPSSASAQNSTPPWFAGVYFERDNFSGDSPVWKDWTAVRALALRRLERATIGVEVASIYRFDRSDRSVAGEAYVDLVPGTYAHVRLRVTPEAELLPDADLRAEITRSLGGGWEGSASLWYMNVTGPDVLVGGIGGAKYISEWYLRGQASLARISGANALSGGFFARRFLGGSSREYFEVGGGVGREIVSVGSGPILDARNTAFLSASHQRFVDERLGFNVAVGVSDFEGIPLRRTLSLGLLTRF